MIMSITNRTVALLSLSVIVTILSAKTSAFAPSLSNRARVGAPRPILHRSLPPISHLTSNHHVKPSPTSLYMSKSRSPLAVAGVLLILSLFIGTAFMPLIGNLGNKIPVGAGLPSRPSDPSAVVVNDQNRLSRAAIQEKLGSIPVFYLLDDKGDMSLNIYMSYADAKEASASTPGSVVTVSSLDQVEYPLILRRGRMRMAPPPIEVAKAEATLNEEGRIYHLIPSKQALKDAQEFGIDLGENNFPLFLADRLAFAAPGGGIQLPMFMEKNDVVTSYERLRETNKNLPETPIFRPTTLNDELFSMEKGTRYGLSQLTIYPTADDVNQAVQMITGK